MSEADRQELVRAFERWVDATSHNWRPPELDLARAVCRVLGAELYWRPLGERPAALVVW